MSAAEAATVVVVVGLAGAAVFALWLSHRRAARRAAEAARLDRERRAKEQELLERVRALRKRDDLSAAKTAIQKDPVRAAKVVSRMMRGKTEK